MKFHLRNLAMGAALLASTAVFAQEPTVTMKWRHSFNSEAHDVRGGCAAQGKVYFADGTDNAIKTVDENGNVELFYQHTDAINRGFTVDDEGNVMIAPTWPTSADNLNKWMTIKASDKSTADLELDLLDMTAGRADMFGRTVGDIFSEDGGICYMTAAGATFPLPLWVAEGEQIVPNSIGGFAFPAATNMTYAVPAFGTMDQFFDEFDEPGLAGACYYRVFNGNPTYTTDFNEESGEFTVVTIPEPQDLPEGYSVRQINFETFEVGGNRYFCCGVSSEAQNWGSNFCIYDAAGHVVFISDNGSALDAENKYNSSKTGNGGGLVARQIDDNTVQLYQLYACGDANRKNFAAMYEITLGGAPVQADPLYITGGFDGWNPGNPTQFTYADGKYTLAYTSDGAGFKISTAKGSWDQFNAGGLSVDNLNLVANTVYTLKPNTNAGNMNIAKGDYTLVVDLANMTIEAQGATAPFEAPELYLRGGVNGWGADEAYKFTTDGEVVEGLVTYTLALDTMEGEFKVGNADWSVSLGSMGQSIDSVGEYTLNRDGGAGNITWNVELVNIVLTVKYPEDITAAPTLIVAGEEPVVVVPATRKAFAYGLKSEAGENGTYTITYSSSAEAKAAVLVLTDAEGQPINIELPAPVAGENTAEVNLADYAEGTYTWAINLVSESEADGVVYTSEEIANLYATTPNRDKNGRLQGGAVWMNDAEYDSYGYTVIGLGAANGYFVFDPAGKLLTESAVHSGESNKTNASSTFRGDALRDKAVFADWSDGFSGYWAIDPLNLDAPRYNMLMPEGATMASSGLVTYNGVQTGSGSACVAFGGKGEETMMYGYDEDIYNNQVVGYALGTANYITEAPVIEKIGPYSSYSLNADIKATDAYHIWVNMGRANGNDSSSTVCLGYYEITKDTMTNDDGDDVEVYTQEQLWNSAGKDLFEDGTQGAFAVSPDGKTIVADSQNGKFLYVLDVEFNEWGEPEVTLNRTIDVSEYRVFTASNVARGQMAFDAAGNIHYNNVFGQTYQVWTLKGESTATTPAKSTDVIAVVSGVEDLNAAVAAEAEYFNLNGIRVAADNLTPGIYIRRQGTQATKVLVK